MLNLYNILRNENTKRQRDNTPSSELWRHSGTDFLSTVTPEEFESFDLLAWWKRKETEFPILSAMARDLLTVQASTVASELAFSFSGRVLSVRRTRLTPTALEMCICLKDHLDARKGYKTRPTSKTKYQLKWFCMMKRYNPEHRLPSPMKNLPMIWLQR
ncbi:hypothetical protein QVD17_20871 [Tagetes erecta]|uniref:HAT C-terminal dimerisation domain-containing protein n=1 Tax=Tagetes erecta TaxID=13708 RepID=A0AAD8KMH2_TARER|nr:hypothetical protein QVD17_20871 [Tagetes erecta]